MKRIYNILSLSVATLVFAVSCAKEEVPVSQDVTLVKKTFTADFVETRTSLVDGKKVHWTDGDKISVFDNVNKTNGVFEEISINGAAASFSGYTADGATEYVAVYPYKFGSSYDASNKKITVNIPCQQKAVKGSFDNNLNIAVATSYDGSHFAFKNVCALLKVTIPEEVTNVRAMSFVTGTYISGKVEVTLNDDGTFAVAGNTNQNNSFKEVNMDNGGEAMEPGDYYFVVMPGTYNKIYLAVTTTDDELYTYYSNSNQTVNSNDVINLGNVPTDGKKKFRITNLASAPISLEDNWTIGYEIGDDYTGGDLTWSNRNSNIIGTAPSKVTGAGATGTAEIVFGKRPGIAILNATYDGVTYPITFDVRPWYRDEPTDWYLEKNDAMMSDVKTSAQGEDYVEITSNTSGNGNIKRTAKPWFSPTMAPIVCIRMTDVQDQDGYTSTIKFDCGNFKYNNVTFSGEVGNGNRKAVNIYSLSDGSKVFVYDLSKQAIKTAAIPEDFLADGNLTFKICDFKKNGSVAQATYKFFWFRTFGSLDDLEDYLDEWSDETGLTYEKTK